jgi:peptidoglycan/LPS O-acetylase OafA/YrhL
LRSLNFKYIPELDQLRGAAALLVLFFHSIAATEVVGRFMGVDGRGVPLANNALKLIIANGFTGVALFFVISGFIFTWGALQVGKFDWKAFYTNRLLRIYPLYILLVLATVMMNYGSVSIVDVVGYLTGFGNLHPALGQFDVVLWTISVELQFYMLFPFLLMLLKRKGPWHLVGLIAIMIMLRTVARASDLSLTNPVYWTMLGRLDQFLVGMILAWLVQTRGWLAALQRSVSVASGWVTARLVAGLVLAGAAMVVAQQIYYDAGWKAGDGLINVAWPTIDAAMWALVAVFYVAVVRRFPRKLMIPLQFVGTISYSLYLLHYPIVKALYRQNIVPEIAGHHFLSGLLFATFVVLPVSIVAATITYYVIEKPPLDLRKRYAKPSTREQHLATIYGLHGGLS